MLDALQVTHRSVWPLKLFRNRRLLFDLYWCVFAACRCVVYEAWKGPDQVFHAYVTGPSLKFPFMEDGDVQIGDCHTAVQYRGRGIYPAMVERIFRELVVRPGAAAYLLIDAENRASKRGAEKAGFALVGQVRVEQRFMVAKVYHRTSAVDGVTS